MISRKELEYVSYWANKTPYPGYEYSKEALLKLKQAVEKYQSIYNGIEYNISFSNSEEIVLTILQKNLLHMLGLEYKNLMNEYKVSFRKTLGLDAEDKVSSYELLNLIINNIDSVLKYEDETGNKNLNFYKIRVKCEIFEKMANVMDFNFGCVNFDRNVYIQNSTNGFSANSEKLLFTQSNEPITPYFMIGIKPDNCGNEEDKNQESFTTKYIVETLFAPYNIKDFFNNQEVTIPTQILFDYNDELTKTSATSDQKRKIIAMYKEIINLYGLDNRLNIFGDYMELLFEQESFQKQIRRV